MGRIFAVISVVVFAVALGCGEAPESIGNQGDGNGGGGGGNSGLVSPVDVDEECFDFGEFGEDRRHDWDERYDWAYHGIANTQSPWDPSCIIDGVGFQSDECVDRGEGVDQDEYHNVCKEYNDTNYDGLDLTEPCLWKIVAEMNDDDCRYFPVCLTEEDYPLVPSYDFHFPDGWDEAVDKYCVD